MTIQSVNAFSFNGISKKGYDSSSGYIGQFMEALGKAWAKGTPIDSVSHKSGTIIVLTLSQTLLYGLMIKGDPAVSAILSLNKDGKFFQVEAAMVIQRFIGKGYGQALYETALNQLGTLQSSTDLSVGSSLLWSKLCTRYNGVVVVPTKRGQDQEVQIKGWTKFKGNTVPLVVNRLGKTVSLGPMMNGGSGKSGRVDYDEYKAAQNFFYRIRK